VVETVLAGFGRDKRNQGVAPHYGEGIASNAAMLTPGIEM